MKEFKRVNVLKRTTFISTLIAEVKSLDISGVNVLKRTTFISTVVGTLSTRNFMGVSMSLSGRPSFLRYPLGNKGF